MSSEKPGCLGFLFGFGSKRQIQTQFPYKAKQYFFSNTEASFYHFLKQIVGESVTIFPHVVLRDLVILQKGLDNSSRSTHYNKIDRKQVDFLLVDSKTLKPILVIELDDSSHQDSKRIQRDEFVDKVLEFTGIPIVHIPVKQSYDAKELTELFKQKIQLSKKLGEQNA